MDYIRDNTKPPALPPALRQKMADRLCIPDTSIPSDDFFLSDFMQHALAELMGCALGTKSGSKVLTGFIIIQLRYFDFLHRGCSINRALDGFEDPHVEESVFELLRKHSIMTGRQMTVSSPEMLHLSWLKSASPKTAGRYAESAMKSIISFLGDCLSELFNLVSSTPAAVATVAIKKGDDAIDLATLINKYTAATCSLSSPAYGIQIPIAECVGRFVHAKREPHAVRSEHLPNYLANGAGTIAGLPGSGRSVLMQSIALLGNQNNLYACYYFIFSLRTFLERIKEGYTLPQFIVAELIDGMPCGDEQRLRLVATVDELIAERHWVLLADDLERLDWTSQELVIAKLANATSVYFTVTPWMVDDVHELMRRNKYAGNLVMLSLDDVDLQTRGTIAKVAAKYMRIPYVDGCIEAEFEPWNATEGTTPLGVLAALKTMVVPGDRKHLHFGYLFLQEILQRSGHPGLHLPRHPDDLNAATVLLLRAGRAAREELKCSEPGQIFDHVRNTRHTALLCGDLLADLLGDPIQQLLDMRVFMHRRYQTTVQFIYPAVEELLMTLDSYYLGYTTSVFDFLFPGSKSPLLQRVRQSIAYVPQLLGF
ncbi:MAG TPA: NACHT domain-containing protein [Anaerolineales bacterium]|nr:NACHT domain-containing protein [Anaerolineales bacterium]